MMTMMKMIKSPKNTQGYSSTTKLNSIYQHQRKNALLKVLTMSNLRLHVTLRIKILIKRISNGQDLLILLIVK